MLIIEGQKLKCRICNTDVSLENDLVFSGNYEANENAPLFLFNDSIIHQRCFELSPLKEVLLERIKELELLAEIHKTDYITGEPLDLEQLGHPDNLITVFYLTPNPENPLYKFNGINLNKQNLEKWSVLEYFKGLLNDLNNSSEWKGNSIKHLLNQLNSPVYKAW
jgi:hypothetical protein